MIIIIPTDSRKPVVSSEPFLDDLLSENLFSLKHLGSQSYVTCEQAGFCLITLMAAEDGR